jgi:hypothetical protein
MVTISFLLITAVWTKMSRVESSAKVPGDRAAPPCDAAQPCEPVRELHVDMRQADRFSLSWREQGSVLRSREVPRRQGAPVRVAVKPGTSLQFPELREAVGAEYQAEGAGPRPPRAVLHTANDARYEDIIAAMDAIDSVRRSERGAPPAFVVTLAAD